MSAPIVVKWQRACTDLSLVVKANDQLKVAFLQLWELAKKSGSRVLKRQLIHILRKVKGPSPHVEITQHTPLTIASRLLRPLYAFHIVKTDDFSFAPAVLKMEKCASEFHSIADNDPAFLWLHMITLENCHNNKNISLFSLHWKTIHGDKSTIGTRSYEAYQKFSVVMTASELRSLDHPKSKPHYFIRKTFERYIDRLCKEIMLAVRAAAAAPQQKLRLNLARRDTRLDDKAIGTEKMRGYFQKNQDASLTDAASWLDRQVNSGEVVLERPREMSTYKAWAREAGLQPEEAKVRGKDKKKRKKASNL